MFYRECLFTVPDKVEPKTQVAYIIDDSENSDKTTFSIMQTMLEKLTVDIAGESKTMNFGLITASEVCKTLV